MYARLKNGIVDKVQAKPKWFYENGEPVEDDTIFMEDGIYPLIDIEPFYNPRTQTCSQLPKEQWTINTDSVEITYSVTDKSLETAISDTKAEINRIRYGKIYRDSISYTFPGDTEPDGIQMRDETDRQNLQDIMLDALIKDPASVMYFMPVSNNLKTMTAQDMIDMGTFLKNRGDTIMEYSWQLKGQISIATSLQGILDINIDTGWPA